MKLNNLSLPHPVLGLGDDVEGDYPVKCNVKSDESDITLVIDREMKNEKIKSLIGSGKALHCVEVNCPQTFYRDVIVSSEDDEEVILPADCFYNKVLLSFYIIATEDISDYTPEGMNADYGNSKFTIEKGDLIAYGGETSFIADKTDLGMKATKSIMTVQVGPTEKGPLKYILEDERIIIQMPKKDLAKYRELYSILSFSPIFHASIAYPALLYALAEYFKKPDDYSSCRWLQAMEWKRDEQKLWSLWNEESVPELTQKILDNPIGRGLDGMEIIKEKEDREEF